jgi:type I restriction enzyme S subunit
MSNPDFWDGSIPWISPKDMKRSRLSDAIDHVTEKALANGAKVTPARSLLLVVRGMILAHTFPVARTEVPVAFNQDIKALIPRSNIDSDYLLWWLTANESLLLSLTTESTHGTKRVPMDGLQSVEVDLPPLFEQRAIAAALSDVDALLDGLTRLIAKKRDIKHSAIQRLLTGQTRLPGFQGQWAMKQLGDVGTFLKGSGVTKDQARSGDLPCVRYGEIYTRHNDFIKSFNSWISAEVATTATRLKRGDLLFAGSGETKEEIGKCVALTSDCEAFAGGDIVILRLVEGHPMFMGYYCNSAPIQTQKAAKGQGDAVVHISAGALSSITVSLPSLAEQTAIATVLSDMDAELSALEARRDKTGALKQAMMQELLTGRTRLVIPTVTESRKGSERSDGRRANIYFMRSVLAAEIIDRLHAEPTFGHVKFEKMIFLVEHLCNVDTGSTYHRDAAGPYDNKAMRSIDSQLRKQRWFDARKIEERYQYQPMVNRGKHKVYFERYFAGIGASFDTIINTFRTFSTERCEIVATLFAAWNDLLKQNAPISDDVIVGEVLNNWHESKKRIPADRWRKALAWMRDKGFAPKYGGESS